MGVDYFIKWKEEEVAKIIAERFLQFSWKKIMCRFGLPKIIVSENGTQFASTTIAEIFRELGFQIKIVSIVHPQANGKFESTNKVILKRIKKKLHDAKVLWA